jgi:large subunit ribosomal protein L35
MANKNQRTKAKTHKGIAKRFKVTGSGEKASHRSANRGHLKGKQTGKRKRQLRSTGIVTGVTAKMIADAIRPSL